jgi:hypothetical protein
MYKSILFLIDSVYKLEFVIINKIIWNPNIHFGKQS